jgi:putative membrane protein
MSEREHGESVEHGTGIDRKPSAVYGVGGEPDVQASLANERTALSWIRTGLALVAGGVALATLASFGELPTVIVLLAGLSSLGGGVLAVWALVGWRRTERALRLREPLPAPSALPWLVTAVVAVAIFLAAFTSYQALTGV